MQSKRINLYNKYRDNAKDVNEFDRKYPSFSRWSSVNFKDKNSVKSIWNKSLKATDKKTKKKFWANSEDEFYKTFACDLSWAKQTATACGAKISPTPPTPLTPEQKQEKAEKCGHANWDDYKNSGWKCSKSVTPSPGTSGYKECTDFYQLNCKDTGSSVGRPNTNGPIYKVQGCIGVKQDSFFGPKTQSALQAKIGKNYFTEDQVEAICKGEIPGGTSPAIEMPLTQEQKEQYWNDLIEKERIYDQGLIYTLKDGNVVYIVKTELNNPDVKLPLSSLKDADLTVNDFIVMYPIKKGEPRGKFGLLTKYKTPSGEEKVKITQNPRWYWSPEEEVESIDMFESKITNILKNVLSEQKFSGRMTTPTQPGTTTTTNTGTPTQPGTTTTSGSGTKPTGDQPQQGGVQSQQTTTTTTQPGQTQEEPKELDATQCRDLVVQYLYGAFTASNMEAVGSAMAKGKILDPKTIKNRLCGCYKLGDLNDIEISKNDFTSGKYRLNPDFLNFRFLNKKLKWPEIKKLVQTGENKGFEIGRGYTDSSFGEREMCIGQVNESVKQTIKSHISEAINKKKKLTESIVNKVTKKLI